MFGMKDIYKSRGLVKCHIYHLGMGGNRKKDIGRGCNCDVNLIYLTPRQHDELDRRIELPRNLIRAEMVLAGGYSYADIYRDIFAHQYHYVKEFEEARKHFLDREKGLTECSKSLKK